MSAGQKYLLPVSKIRQWGFLLSGLTVFALLIVASLQYEKERINSEQFERLTTKARVIDENVVRQLEGVRDTLKSVLNGHSVAFSRGNASEAADPHLAALAEATLGVRTFFIMDGSGSVIAASRDGLVGRNFSDREYFTTPLKNPDPESLYLSEPFTTLLGIYSVNLVRVTKDSNGRVTMVAAATLEPEFFSVLLSSVRFHPDVWVALAHSNGSLVLRYPERPELLGRNLQAPGSFFSRHVASGRQVTVLTGLATASGNQGWMAQRTISAPQLNMKGALVVAIARDPDMALAAWRNLAWIGSGLFAIVSTAGVVGLLLFQRYQAVEQAELAQAEKRRRLAEEEVKRMAFYDPLTELPNRRLLMDRMQQQLASSLRNRKLSCLFFLDLDGFKQLNDSLGHDCGDRLLQEVAKRLRSIVRTEDTAARWGGDEFAVMLSGLTGDTEAAQAQVHAVASKMLESIGREYNLDGHPYRCTASIGVALFGSVSESLDDVFRRADEAMYRAKTGGRNAFELSSQQSSTVD